MKPSFHPYNFARSPFRRFLIYISLFVGVGMLLMTVYLNITPRDHTRVLWIVDTSLSMQVQDMMTSSGILLSRLAVAQNILTNLSMQEQREQALMVFGSHARILLPFTRDQSSILSTIETLSPEIYASASDLWGALTLTQLLYQDTPLDIRILTDGENMEASLTGVDTIKNISLTIFWIGTVQGGPMIQGYDSDGMPRYKQFEWQRAISRRDDTFLLSLVEKLGWKYRRVDNPDILPSMRENYFIKNGFDTHHILLFSWVCLIIFWLFLPPAKYQISSHAKK